MPNTNKNFLYRTASSITQIIDNNRIIFTGIAGAGLALGGSLFIGGFLLPQIIANSIAGFLGLNTARKIVEKATGTEQVISSNKDVPAISDTPSYTTILNFPAAPVTLTPKPAASDKNNNGYDFDKKEELYLEELFKEPKGDSKSAPTAPAPFVFPVTAASAPFVFPVTAASAPFVFPVPEAQTTAKPAADPVAAKPTAPAKPAASDKNSNGYDFDNKETLYLEKLFKETKGDSKSAPTAPAKPAETAKPAASDKNSNGYDFDNKETLYLEKLFKETKGDSKSAPTASAPFVFPVTAASAPFVSPVTAAPTTAKPAADPVAAKPTAPAKPAASWFSLGRLLLKPLSMFRTTKTEETEETRSSTPAAEQDEKSIPVASTAAPAPFTFTATASAPTAPVAAKPALRRKAIYKSQPVRKVSFDEKKGLGI